MYESAFKTMAKDVIVGLMMVSPKQAEEWLESSKGFENRPIRQKRVSALVDAICAGRWKLNGESIVFDSFGVCIDGQHRLNAVLQSGISVPFVVVFGIRPEAYPTIDVGSARTAGDVLRHAGVAQANTTAAVLRLLLACKEGRSMRNLMTDHTLVLGSVGDWPSLPKVVTFAGRIRPIFPCASAIAMAYIACESDDRNEAGPKADLFFKLLETGADLSVGNPILALRDRLIRLKREQSRGGNTIRPDAVAYLVFRAWSAWLEGASMSKLPLPHDGLSIDSFNALNPFRHTWVR